MSRAPCRSSPHDRHSPTRARARNAPAPMSRIRRDPPRAPHARHWKARSKGSRPGHEMAGGVELGVRQTRFDSEHTITCRFGQPRKDRLQLDGPRGALKSSTSAEAIDAYGRELAQGMPTAFDDPPLERGEQAQHSIGARPCELAARNLQGRAGDQSRGALAPPDFILRQYDRRRRDRDRLRPPSRPRDRQAGIERGALARRARPRHRGAGARRDRGIRPIRAPRSALAAASDAGMYLLPQSNVALPPPAALRVQRPLSCGGRANLVDHAVFRAGPPQPGPLVRSGPTRRRRARAGSGQERRVPLAQ